MSAGNDVAGPVRRSSTAGFCVFLAAAATVATGQLFGYLGFTDEIDDELGVGAAWGLPLFAIGYAMGMIIVGSFAGQWGPRRVLVFSLTAGGLLCALSALMPTVPLLLGVRFVEGVALGGFPPAAFTAVTLRVPPSRRLPANACMVFGLLGSAGLIGLCSKGLEVSIGWRGGLGVYACALLAMAFVASKQRGIASRKGASSHPYRLVASELGQAGLVFTVLVGALVMAIFVTVNGAAQRSSWNLVSLAVVLGVVLAVLVLARHMARLRPEFRRITGTALTMCGAITVLVDPAGVVLALGLTACGATIAIPASIQIAVANARHDVAAAVSAFTCSLFVGGALAGVVNIGLLPVDPQMVLITLVAGSFVAIGVGVAKSRRTLRTPAQS